MMIDKFVQQDIEALAEDVIFEQFKAKSVFLVTGATGLIGSLITGAIVTAGQKSGKEFRVIAIGRNEQKAQELFGGYGDGVLFVKADVLQELPELGNVDYIIHAASPTGSRFFVEKPVETIMTAVEGTKNLLEYALKKQVKKFVYLSSLEVYGIPSGKEEFICEHDYGYLDPMQVRSSYSEGKRMVECLCCSYQAEYNVPVVIARLSQTFGPGVAYTDGRVFAEFSRCKIEGRDIVLHTPGRTVRTYCATRDAVRALLVLLAHGENGEAYNVSNMQTAISIREMAEVVAGLDGKAIRVIVESENNGAKYGYNPEMIIRLDTSKLQALGWHAEIGLEDMFSRLIESMKGSR